MANNLLNLVINNQIELTKFYKWISDSKYQDFSSEYQCSRVQFITFFLNFIHEEIGSSCHEKNIEIDDCEHRDNNDSLQLQTSIKRDVNKSRSFSTDLSQELDGSTNSSSTPKVLKVNSNSNVLNLMSPVSPIFKLQDSFSTSKSNKSAICQELNGSTNSSSTLKVLKVNSNSNVLNLISPVSPIYKLQDSFSTPKSNKSAICLGDFIFDKTVSSKKKSWKKSENEAKKRIKPTNLLQQKSSSFHKTENSFDFNNSDFGVLPSERNELVEERLKILNRTEPLNSPSSKKFTYSFNETEKIEIKPDVQFVTYKLQIDEIIKIYRILIDNNLVLNLASEVYFFITLLLKKQFYTREWGVVKLPDKIIATHVFKSIHNLTYFAANSLQVLTPVLENYDKASIRLLTENVRLCKFVPDLVENLKLLQKSDNVIEVDNLQDNVCFNLDTDNRQNFPNELSFHAFRKQRDLFYEILRIWEIHHLSPSFNFSFSLSGKIQSLFRLSDETMNFIHFVRLFKAQLLSTCRSRDCDNFLTSLEIDAQKLSKLRNRCVTREHHTEVTTSPQFNGSEEFYRDFILVAGNYIFNRHLSDAFIEEIFELNETSFNCSEFNKGDEVDLTTKKSYYFCIKSLRLLAKFLGFLETLPYKSGCSVPEQLLRNHVKIRHRIVPNLDIQAILQKSIKSKTIILCIPWIVKYLSMLDFVTLSLPYYTTIFNNLFWLYKNFIWAPKSNIYLIKFALGWLFHLSHLPDRNYLVFDAELEGYQDDQKETDRTITYLDELQMIDHNILYFCCPHLEEIKKLLSFAGTGNTVPVKHITPVTALQYPEEIAKKKIQVQLEEAFFNGQPVSLKKTVEFVSERIASLCVKHICTSLVPQFKKNALEKFRNSITIDEDEDVEIQKIVLKNKSSELATLCLIELQAACDSEIEKIASSRIQSAIESLVALDILLQTKNVCISLSKKSCIERVKQWLMSHVTLGIFLKEFNDELQKFFSNGGEKCGRPVFALPPCGTNVKHDEYATSAAHLLEKYRALCLCTTQHNKVATSVFVALLNDTIHSIEQRGDINQCILATLCTQLLDLCILLLVIQPNLITDEAIFSKCCQIWKLYYNGGDGLFKSLLCLRNVEIFKQAKNCIETWNAFAKVCNYLIEKEMLSCDQFESQCTGLFKTEWDKVTLSHITNFLKTFVKLYNGKQGSGSHFTFLLNFLSDFCEDIY